MVLGDGEFLLLGDHSAHSLDGRYFGPVHRDDIVGKVVRVYWPFSRARVPE
ncbi:MAG: signal peptidase I, partial [Gammaproteobacteria bacterium]|nr:signal peptidase I [Gemmatimonadota bacterium]NIR36517.1 signal peptidase I [Actinomycetota bacterium]NIU77162.1 signal peptidase I [Gammaproteobacteria bacterium]